MATGDSPTRTALTPGMITMTGHRPWRELVERTFTPARRARLEAEVATMLKVAEAYDDALERMTGRRQPPLMSNSGI